MELSAPGMAVAEVPGGRAALQQRMTRASVARECAQLVGKELARPGPRLEQLMVSAKRLRARGADLVPLAACPQRRASLAPAPLSRHGPGPVWGLNQPGMTRYLGRTVRRGLRRGSQLPPQHLNILIPGPEPPDRGPQ